ncbi:tetratricopeptide repeat protein [Pleionea sediminis]|uniref:tetratricopeptide repeat protein n=1 Tax=Pleionea sediminis TaxID=2569479 RepID=UPI001185767A|nr:hypothetical protein [Pleionea sediminis]
MLKKIAIFVLISFVIGNTIAWLSGAAPIKFEPVEISDTEEQLRKEYILSLKEDAADKEALVYLGSLYSNHNLIDKAHEVLEKAFELYPSDPMVQAFYYANESKRAGAMIDLSMGVYKLFKLQEAIDGINRAVEADEGNLLVRINRLITFGYLGDVNNDFETVFEDEKWVMPQVENQKVLPNDVYQHMYVALANAYKIKSEETKNDDVFSNKYEYYIDQIASSGGCPQSSVKQCKEIIGQSKE